MKGKIGEMGVGGRKEIEGEKGERRRKGREGEGEREVEKRKGGESEGESDKKRNF